MNRIRVADRPEWTDDVVALVRSAGPGPAGNRLVGVDGYSGSGKSTLAGRLADRLGAPLLTLEEITPGWDGLAAAIELARIAIAEPLAHGRDLRPPTWDWHAGAPGPVRSVAAAPVVVLEGCGAGSPVLAPTTSLLVWVDVPAGERERRLRARDDWEVYAPFRERWRAQEAGLAGTDRRADVVLDNEEDPAAPSTAGSSTS
ncbi:uridine kinase family protein [Pseudonocardia endophytica]|uniref:Uridine kinase n=1 Tax=Pseudonocardia endophytica TaxID=401976 RepID=A0A4R1HVW8_PSEEN|nr:hypothetical protein [Pseudonocardia endophytica]TCK26887.1 uridine kinase [Pseudonocardia endophytica]